MITLIIPYYCQPNMLARQMKEIAKYPEGIRVVVVDDGSPDPAADAVEIPDYVSVYRIDADIAWNREQARNIGAYVCETDWLIQVDTDHILPLEAAEALLSHNRDSALWYRFPRYRVGRADSTRKKDPIHHLKKFGRIHPHIDSYLMTRAQYLTAPYNEAYSGHLGGGTPFLEVQKKIHGEPHTLPDEICLHVYTSHEVSDSSIVELSRDKAHYSETRKRLGDVPPKTMLFNDWHQVQWG